MKGVEFYNSPSGQVIIHTKDDLIILSKKDSAIIDEMLDLIKDNYPGAFEALDICYEKSRPNTLYHRYQMVSRFIRCNLGNNDTMQLDIDDNGCLNLEQVPCPLRGTGDCPYENIICCPKRSSILAPRQLELASLLAAGYCNNEIAIKMCISINTVHNTIQFIKSKLKLKNTGQIIAWYNTYHDR